MNVYFNASAAALFLLPCRWNVQLDTLAACRTSGRELGIRHGKAGTFAKGNYLHHFQRIVDELWLDAGPSGEPDQAFLETLRTA